MVISSLSLHAGAGPGRRYRAPICAHRSSTSTYRCKQKSSKSAIIGRSSSRVWWVVRTSPIPAWGTPCQFELAQGPTRRLAAIDREGAVVHGGRTDVRVGARQG